MKKRLRWAIIGSGVVAGAAALAESARQVVTGYFVSIAMNRKAPPYPASAEKRIAGSCIDEKLLQQLEAAGQRLGAREHDVVHLESRDGTALLGHWFPCENPKRVIVAMHGWRSSWSRDFGLVMDFFRNNGCCVLCPEQRGQGGSGGAYMSFGLAERYDCLDWAAWVAEKMPGAPVYLCGVSMGASTVLMAAGLELPENVRGVIADCGFTSPAAIWEHVAKNHLHLRYDLCNGPARRKWRRRLALDMDAGSCVEAMKVCAVPVLFVHGEADRFVPVEMTYENYAACAAPKELLIVKGAEHGMSYLTDPAAYEKKVLEFWQRFDKDSTHVVQSEKT